MNGVNKVFILGNLGKDPEIKELQSGSKVANLPVATTENFKDRNGERQERTEWHNVDLWNRQAEIAEQYLSKGDTVFIEGTIRTDKWQDQEGNDRYTTKIRGLSMTMLGKRNRDEGGGGSAPAAASGPEKGQNQPEGGSADLGQGEDDSDDLPF
jgi:single-strand DNA-binding protein